MKKVFFLLLYFVTIAVRSEDTVQHCNALGQLTLVHLDSAPFPHPLRADGRKYQNEIFTAEKNYQDNTVAIFVPRNFRLTNTTDFVIHFHGWRNNVTNVLAQYQLVDQLIESGRNAILVVPQGPRNAADSFGGRLEDTDGFKRFMRDVLTTLQKEDRFKNLQLGKIILSGHSGGYQVISSILDRGGLTDHVAEVWLFDALYARTEKFVAWFEKSQGRLLNIYTEHGGTKDDTEQLITDMAKKKTPFLKKNEPDATDEELRTNRLSFLFTSLPHDSVLEKRRTFRVFLKTSFLSPTPNPNAFVAPLRRELKGKHLSLEQGTLYVPDFFKSKENQPVDVVFFFHGAAWCAEQNFYDARKNAVLVSINSTNKLDSDKKFTQLLEAVSETWARENITTNKIGKICLASFSGGYVGVRDVLKNSSSVKRISDVVLADSLYAPRNPKKTNELDPIAMQPFLNVAKRAADGKTTFIFSQLYPPQKEYRGNTTTLTAGYLIDQIKAEQLPGNYRNARGAELLYRADKGNFHVLGYSGMTTQDHFDHFYNISELFKLTSLKAAP